MPSLWWKHRQPCAGCRLSLSEAQEKELEGLINRHIWEEGGTCTQIVQFITYVMHEVPQYMSQVMDYDEYMSATYRRCPDEEIEIRTELETLTVDIEKFNVDIDNIQEAIEVLSKGSESDQRLAEEYEDALESKEDELDMAANRKVDIESEIEDGPDVFMDIQGFYFISHDLYRWIARAWTYPSHPPVFELGEKYVFACDSHYPRHSTFLYMVIEMLFPEENKDD